MKNISFCKVYKSDVEEVVEVDLRQCKNDKDIFNVFKEVFQFPEWFGENWDAFHDCMANLCFDVQDVLVVRVYGFQHIFEISKASANHILEDLIILSKGEATQDNGNKFNAIIYLIEVNADCEKFILDKDISGLEFVSNNIKYICPICGYDRLEFYPSNSYEICHCCGYEFGTFDYFEEDLCGKFHEEDEALFAYIRNVWIKNGSMWWSTSDKKPKNWSWEEQLKNIDSLPKTE